MAGLGFKKAGKKLLKKGKASLKKAKPKFKKIKKFSRRRGREIEDFFSEGLKLEKARF